MRIDLISDIHLDMFEAFDETFDPDKVFSKQGSDILLVGGDICQCIASDKNDLVDEFFEDVTKRYKHVLFVLGNHDYWNKAIWCDSKSFYFENMKDRALGRYPKVHFLSMDTPLYIDGFWFVGDTLWSNPRPHTYSLISKRMNDYRMTLKENGEKLTVNDTVKAHKDSLLKLGKTLDTNKDKPFIVLTHHLPFPNKRYIGDPTSDAYSTDLSNFILLHPNIKLWCCGHDHSGMDENVLDCRIVSNPHGYYMYEDTKYKTVKTYEV